MMFERSLQRIMESADGEHAASSLLVQTFLNCARALSASLSVGSKDELKQMKTLFKDRLTQYEFDLKQRARDVTSLKQALEKSEQSFGKTQTEIKRVHAKSLEAGDGARRRSFSWSPLRVESKDQVFERLQKLVHEQSRLSSESECLFKQVSSAHQTAYSRFSGVMNELGSMRRRLNRRTAGELKSVASSLTTQLKQLISDCLPQVSDKADECCPCSGDFGMRLPSVNDSLSSLIGPDASIRIKGMMNASDSGIIEYRAVQSYVAKEKGEISFNRNDRIDVIEKDSSGWWVGKNLAGNIGLFPSVYLVQRPAGAILPLQKNSAVSFKPELVQGSSLGTWKPQGTLENERAKLVSNNPPFAFIGIIQFPFNGNGISVEPGEVVEVQQIDSHSPSLVIVVNARGIKGVVPIHIMTLKYRSGDQENERNLSNWSLPV